MVQSLLTLTLLTMTSWYASGWKADALVNEYLNKSDVPYDDLSLYTACDYVYGFDIQAIFGIDGDVIGEEMIRVEKLSSCSYHWFNHDSGKEEHLELRLELNDKSSGESFEKNLEETLEKGELKHPMKPQNGRILYELIEGPGDMTIWSSEERALRWHLKDNYYFIMNLDESVSTRSPEEDLSKLITLAGQINQRMGLL